MQGGWNNFKKLIMQRSSITSPYKGYGRYKKETEYKQRTVLLSFDVMLEKGTRYYATFKKEYPETFDLTLGKWVVNLETIEKLKELVCQRFPSLRNRDFLLCPNF